VLSFIDIAAGFAHTCALTSLGDLFCWGANGQGQLGNGTSVSTSKPTRVSSTARFKRVSAGFFHTCAISTDDAVYCWGDNHAGALGIGQGAGSDYPVPVSGGRHFGVLSVGDYATCGIENQTGLAYCWGFNEFGDLGDGSTTIRWDPTAVAGAKQFTEISASGSHTCAVEAQTALGYCWGRAGLIGDNSTSQRQTPTLVGDGAGRIRFSSVSAGVSHSCGIEFDTGTAYCWGRNDAGQLGNATTAERLVPTATAGTPRFGSISAGESLSCGVETLTGFGYCWGLNTSGQVGDGSTTNRLVPTLVGQLIRLRLGLLFSTPGKNYGAANRILTRMSLGLGSQAAVYVRECLPSAKATVSPGVERCHDSSSSVATLSPGDS